MKKNNFIETLMKYSIISWTSFIISFISIPIMTRIFPPEQMGGITMFQSVSSLLLLISLGGQDQAFARYYNEKEDKGIVALSSYLISTIVWILLFVTIYFSSEKLSVFFYGEINSYAMVMTALVALPLVYLRLSEQIYRMKSQTKNFGFQQIMVNFMTKLGVLMSGLINKNYNLYITIFSIASFLLMLYFITKQIRSKNIEYNKKFIKNDFKELVRFGIPSMFAAITFSLKDFIPRIVLSKYIGLYSVGIYSSAISLASVISILQAGFSTYYVAYFYENYNKNNKNFEKIHHGLTVILILVAITLTVSNELLINLLGSSYGSASRIFPIILWSPVAISISETTVCGINIAKKTKYHIYISIITVIFTLALSIILIPRYSEIGAAFVIGFSGIIFLSLRTFFGFKFLRTVTNYVRTICAISIMIVYSVINCVLTISFSIKIGLYIFSLLLLVGIYKNYLYTLVVQMKKDTLPRV